MVELLVAHAINPEVNVKTVAFDYDRTNNRIEETGRSQILQTLREGMNRLVTIDSVRCAISCNHEDLLCRVVWLSLDYGTVLILLMVYAIAFSC